MDLEAARAELARAVNEQPSGTRFAVARAFLIDTGVTEFCLSRATVVSLDDVVRNAMAAPPSDTRRAYAVLLVDALGVDGLLPMRGDSERAVRSFLEVALLNPLRRAGYPFDGTTYDKRRALAALHATIDQHLRPPEPTMPPWLHGLGRAEN